MSDTETFLGLVRFLAGMLAGVLAVMAVLWLADKVWEWMER